MAEAQRAAYSLSISDLVRVLNEKLGLESSKFRGISLPLTCFASSLESEIDSLEARTQDLLRLIPSLRNVLRPVNRLPPEILSYIARYLIDDDQGDAISIVPLTHVCQYWRESIISAPGIWTLISGKNEDMAAVCLKRAKAAPLKITLRMPLGSSFLDIFAPYLQNTRTLVARYLWRIEELMNVFPNFPQSMPNLRSLELEQMLGADLEQKVDPFESFVPALEQLVLTSIPLFPSLLGLGTLTEFTITSDFYLHLDTLLDFLEGNRSLERVALWTNFTDHSLLESRRKNPMKNQLRYLLIASCDKRVVQALIRSIPLQRGATLHIRLSTGDSILSDFLPDISSAHLSKPPSPTFFQLGYGSFYNNVILDGPGGKLSFDGISLVSFAALVVLPLTNVREVRLSYRETWPATLGPPTFYPSYFPALETLTVDKADALGALSALLSNSPPSPSLKTIGFLNCDLPEDFMEELTRFASERQIISTSTWLHRVQIVHSDGVFPSAASIRRLRKCVKVVEVRMEDDFSMDLTSMALTTPPYDGRSRSCRSRA